MVSHVPKKSDFRLKKWVSRVLKLLSQCGATVLHRISGDTHTRTHTQSSITSPLSLFPLWGRTIFSILNDCSFIDSCSSTAFIIQVLGSEEEASLYVICVCESPEVSRPGSCSLAPPRGPELQKQPLLDLTCSELFTSERPVKSP